MNMTFYPWQYEAKEKIDNAYNAPEHIMMSMASCVGTGKTAMAAYAFGKFIKDHFNENTISLFVAPRINLCNQQVEEIRMMIEKMFNFHADSDKDKKSDYKIWLVNCESNDSFKNFNDNLYNQHNIFVICDESLWGVLKNASNKFFRFPKWISRFQKWDELGYKFGTLFLDEAHNYDKQKEKIMSFNDVI